LGWYFFNAEDAEVSQRTQRRLRFKCKLGFGVYWLGTSIRILPIRNVSATGRTANFFVKKLATTVRTGMDYNKSPLCDLCETSASLYVLLLEIQAASTQAIGLIKEFADRSGVAPAGKLGPGSGLRVPRLLP
jgi:hypothetical protein